MNNKQWTHEKHGETNLFYFAVSNREVKHVYKTLNPELCKVDFDKDGTILGIEVIVSDLNDGKTDT